MYKVYFGNILMPIAPSEIKTKIKNQNKTLTLVNEGELNILKSPGLTELSFTLLLPHVQYTFAAFEESFRQPTYYLSLFEKLKTERQVFDFTVIRDISSGKTLPWKTNMKCSLESYTIKESAESGFDFETDITLKQYIAYGVKTLTIKNNQASSTTKRDDSTKTSTSAEKSYTIKAGDTLWDLARIYLGDGTRWREIYTKNKAVLDAEAKKRGYPSEYGDRVIFGGTKITIPKK